MPHCILEYSTNMLEVPDPQLVFKRLHAELVAAGPFQLKDIKSRLLPREHFLVSDGERDQGFVHLEVVILAGRDMAVRKSVSDHMLNFLKSEFAASAESKNCSFSVSIREFENECYAKELVGTV